MICYSATHNPTGKRYIGISHRDLPSRQAEHESQSVRGSGNLFHCALRKHGKDSFTWITLATGDEEVMKILERVLIGRWETYRPNGFNSMNEASEFELPLSDKSLDFFEEMDMGIAEMDKASDLVDNLVKILNEAIENERFGEKTRALIKPLIDHFKNGDHHKYQ